MRSVDENRRLHSGFDLFRFGSHRGIRQRSEDECYGMFRQLTLGRITSNRKVSHNERSISKKQAMRGFVALCALSH